MRGEGPPQDHFAWGELEGDICVGIAWGRLGYKGSLCGEGVLQIGLQVSQSRLRSVYLHYAIVPISRFSECGYGKMCGD